MGNIRLKVHKLTSVHGNRAKDVKEAVGAVVGDHGYQWYENEQLQYVGFLYDPALRIPFIIKMPGMPGGVKVTRPVMQADLLPTVMELAGVKRLNDPGTLPLPGISLVPLLQGSKDPKVLARYPDRDVMLATYFDNQGIIDRFKYKMIFNRSAGTYLLFDLEHDPAEARNLADERPDILKDLMEKYRRNLQTRNAYLTGKYSAPAK